MIRPNEPTNADAAGDGDGDTYRGTKICLLLTNAVTLEILRTCRRKLAVVSKAGHYRSDSRIKPDSIQIIS